MTLPKITLPSVLPDVAGESGEPQLVGCAVIGALRGFESPLAASILSERIAGRLEAKGINWNECGVLGVPNVLCFLGETTERERALLEIEDVLMFVRLWPNYELAYFDKEDLAWRTVHPQPAKDFGRFLTLENLKRSELALQLFNALIAAAKSKENGE